MADTYTQLVNNPIGSFIAGNLGLPQAGRARPLRPRRAPDRRPRADRVGPATAGSVRRSRRCSPARARASTAASTTRSGRRSGRRRSTPGSGIPRRRASSAGRALVFDASGIAASGELRELWAFFHPTIRRIVPSGRLIVVGTPPEDCADPAAATAQRALEGFVRAAGKELRGGATAQLLYVAPGAEGRLGSSLRFFLSPRSAYVSGQVARIGTGRPVPDFDPARPAARQGRPRHRRRPRDRGVDRPGRSLATALTSSGSTCPPSPPISSG